ncbi:MAG TPA: hypothetical protein VGR47_16210 [Terracidiphilus sp.]|nr:hypothetical protein [Terracidiphilus sp.]
MRLDMATRSGMGKFFVNSVLFAGIAMVFCVISQRLHAQTPTGDCIDYNGHVVRCSAGSGGSSDGSNYSGPSEAEIQAQRAKEEEQHRLIELERQQKLEEDREAAERAKAEEEWRAGVADAASHLKGVTADNMQLKGIGDSTFGLKGVSPEEAAGNPNYGIKARSADSNQRDVITAWKQLHCSAELANYAVEDVHKIATGDADARELDEVKYLAGEAMEALHGNPIGVQCSSAPPVHFTTTPDPQRLTPVYGEILKRTVRDGEALVASREKVESLKKQLADLQAQAAIRYGPKRQPGSDAGTPNERNQESGTDQPQKGEANAQQKAQMQKKPDYLELLRATQRALNEANSEAIRSTADIARVHKETEAIMSGQFSSTAPGNQGQATKGKPVDEQ